MVRAKYPLEALRKLRDEQAETQAKALAAQLSRQRAAEAELQERQRARGEHEARAAEALRGEQDRLSRVGMSGAELARIAEFQRAVRVQAELLARDEAAALEAVTVEREKSDVLRASQALREAEAKLVRNHQASFDQAHHELQEKAEEEAALEQWNARRH
jgi:hypothetical protein